MSIKYAILGLLQYSDMHGYRIKAHIEKNFGHMWSINFGQIYPSLKQLQEEGLVDMLVIAPSENGGPQKKLYSITPKGVKELTKWLTEPTGKSILIRDPFLLKFAFFGFGEDASALKIIDEQIEFFESQLKRRQINRKKWERQGVYVRLLAELGVTQNQMYLEWLHHAKQEIEKKMKKAVRKKA